MEEAISSLNRASEHERPVDGMHAEQTANDAQAGSAEGASESGTAPAGRFPVRRLLHSYSGARRLRLLSSMTVGLVMVSMLTGCSLFVMAGKMFFGDPLFPSAFKKTTGVDLADDEKTVLVLCTTPEAIKFEMPSLAFDLTQGVTRRMRLHGIDVVEPDKVASFIDDNGGRWDEVSEFARHFETDYIIHIELESFSFREQNSPSMLRGRANGSVYAYQVANVGGMKSAQQVFVDEFQSEYPQFHPVSAQEHSPKVFQGEYLDHLCEEFGRKFYDYRLGSEF